MASMTMAAASLLPNLTKNSGTSGRRGGLVVAKAASRATAGEKAVNLEMKRKEERSNNGRREMVLVAAAVAACSMARVAMADEPKPGTPEAKKKYAPICVTMPTARVCHK